MVKYYGTVIVALAFIALLAGFTPVKGFQATCDGYSCAVTCAGLNGGGNGGTEGNNWCWATRTSTSQSLSYVACERGDDCSTDYRCATTCDKPLSSFGGKPYVSYEENGYAFGSGGCSFRFDAINGHCWRYCAGNSGSWCYTSPDANCGHDDECAKSYPTTCKSACAWNSDAGCVNQCPKCAGTGQPGVYCGDGPLGCCDKCGDDGLCT